MGPKGTISMGGGGWKGDKKGEGLRPGPMVIDLWPGRKRHSCWGGGSWCQRERRKRGEKKGPELRSKF